MECLLSEVPLYTVTFSLPYLALSLRSGNKYLPSTSKNKPCSS